LGGRWGQTSGSGRWRFKWRWRDGRLPSFQKPRGKRRRLDRRGRSRCRGLERVG
jgi:hypothetical protein